MPPLRLSLKPSNFLSKMKLTTPETASEPHSAETPPVTTSTRWISICGNWLTSTTPVMFVGIMRSPSIMIKMHKKPKPHKKKKEKPKTPKDEPPKPTEVPVEP